MSERKTVTTIEDLLSWTYRDELPKRNEHGGSWGPGGQIHPMWRAGVFGARIDNFTRDPGYPAAMGDPDPDALEVEIAVNDLHRYGLHGVPPEALLSGLPLEPDVVPAVLERASKSARTLVAMHAKLRTRPGVGICEIQPKRAWNGAVSVMHKAEVEHQTLTGSIWQEVERPCKALGKLRYPTGAYCVIDWTPHPKHILLERAEYLAWRAALAHLAGLLDGTLRRWVVTDTNAPTAPWRMSQTRPERMVEAVAG